MKSLALISRMGHAIWSPQHYLATKSHGQAINLNARGETCPKLRHWSCLRQLFMQGSGTTFFFFHSPQWVYMNFTFT